MLTFVTIIEDPTASSPDFWENVFHINLVLVVLPYFTVMPLTKFLDKLIMLPYTKDKTGMKKKFSKCKYYVGVFIIIVVILACIFAMLVIAANQTDKERLGWLAGYIYVLLQDFCCNPFVVAAIDAVYRRFIGEQSKKRLTTKLLSTILLQKELDEVHAYTPQIKRSKVVAYPERDRRHVSDPEQKKPHRQRSSSGDIDTNDSPLRAEKNTSLDGEKFTLIGANYKKGLDDSYANTSAHLEPRSKIINIWESSPRIDIDSLHINNNTEVRSSSPNTPLDSMIDSKAELLSSQIHSEKSLRGESEEYSLRKLSTNKRSTFTMRSASVGDPPKLSKGSNSNSSDEETNPKHLPDLPLIKEESREEHKSGRSFVVNITTNNDSNTPPKKIPIYPTKVGTGRVQTEGELAKKPDTIKIRKI